MIFLIIKILIAGILVQTLRYKFAGHRESKQIFSELNLLHLPESYGRIGTGVLELVFSIMIFFPKFELIGLLGVIALMLGAICSHVLKLGYEGNRKILFFSGCVALVLSVILVLFK